MIFNKFESVYVKFYQNPFLIFGGFTKSFRINYYCVFSYDICDFDLIVELAV